MNSVAAASDHRRRWLLCGAMALAAFGGKLWLIALYSNPTPFWDEWDALLGSVYLPYFDSTLSLHNFLAPHNEHRMATTRLAGLLLMLANGLWDPVLQMIFNTVIHVGTAVFIVLALGKRLDTFGSAALAVLLTIVIAVPYSWENTLWGVETQFCSVNLFSLLAVYLIVREGDLSTLSVAGLIFGILAFFSAASGALVFLACLPAVVCCRFLGLVKGWRPWLLAALLLFAFVLGVAFTPRLGHHNVLSAQWLRDFHRAYLWLASWPLSSNPNFGSLVVNLPCMWLTWRTLRRPPEAGNIAWVLVALGFWDVLQFSALAYGRTPIVSSSRYLDGVAFNVILNCICLGMLAGRRWLVQIVWAAFIVAGLYAQSGRAFSDAQLRHVATLLEESNVKSFLASGHFLPGASPADLSLPYPDPKRLSAWLSDPRTRRILPSNLQVAIPKDEVGSNERRDRLGFLRDTLLRIAPYLTGLGAFLLLALIAGFALQAGGPPRAMSMGRREDLAPNKAVS